jgi:hypothetical protein
VPRDGAGSSSDGGHGRRLPLAMTVVTELTNYMKLSKKITTGAGNLANLSLYNPVVHETMKDFKPTNIQTKII